MRGSGIIRKEFYEQSMLFANAIAEHVAIYSLKSIPLMCLLSLFYHFI